MRKRGRRGQDDSVHESPPRKLIKIKFVSFWQEFSPQSYPFKDILEERYEVLFSGEPDYVFYSVFGRRRPYEYAKYQGVRIFYTGECFCPDFNVADYAIGFDHINFDDRYLRYPQQAWAGFSLHELADKHKNIDDSILKSKEYFCNFIYSNSDCCPERKGLFDLLNSYKKVIAPGKFLNNTGPDFINSDIYSRSKFAFMEKCKFSIACENFPFRGYLTEKLFHAFGAKTIPIYFGDETVTRDINPRAFINVRDFSSLESVLERVREIDNNDALYLEMLREPVFINKNFAEESGAAIKKFLYNIFDQDYDAAFRRPRIMHAGFHQNCLREYNALVTNFWIRVLNKILRIF